ncbi:NapC/NirT family cytochrome c [Colwellia sp. BRX10-1]|nr:NapC/NirT family cytochrome c [Colwellia sp. BRX10-7]MBA6385623.1 NapC/NirT family cytochrome c [Colwellia sp. BRX10-2]MBA6400548.1 NapC/NirT family cytochrome c [Colwellia sp. BRX10-5]MBA6405524.1 NapC/NirT family cytochrome c [Colwellia sp. BRX10-1]
MVNNTITKPSFWSRRLLLGTTVAGAVLFFVVGIVFWGGFNTAMEATNTTEFCIGCHEMEDNVYQEYKPTIHFSNRTGVRAGCPDCHVPRPWIHKVVRKIQASKEVFSWLTGKLDTKEKFNEHRFELAQSVWKAMKNTDSRECRNCHNFESMNPEYQKPRARKQHLNAFETGQTCIDCHKGIAHHGVRDQLSDEALEALEAPNPEFIREVPQMYLDGLARVEAKESKDAADIKEAELAEKAKIDEKIEQAVQAALTNAGTNSTANKAITDNALATSSSSTLNVDWSKAKSTDISVFYPGTASLEWILGRSHGGKRAFSKGDRCIECHGKEIADIGENIVSGKSEKELEPNIIPGKRGSFPVTIDASHDDESLYLRFSWADGDHAPVPFVEGGKMDPDNPMKLAFMLATDDVEYADRAGCWATCHADANSMPYAPIKEELIGSDIATRLNLNSGVTKYLKESRTELEIKGRGDKALGGWDKLKGQSDIDAAQAENKYMDIVRYKSGSKEVEDGQILAERNMHGGQGAEVEASLKNGTWSVVIKRKLKSDKVGDVSIAAGAVYNFGFAIHDDYSSARYHHVSFGYKLGLDNDNAEINAVKL